MHRTSMIIVASGLLGVIGCGPAGPRQFGQTVDRSAAVRLSSLLTDGAPDRSGLQVVSGRIGEVCRSAGCWFVLQEVVDGKVYELYVDLKPEASFTVPPNITGRPAVVSGHLKGDAAGQQLNAVGLIVDQVKME